MKELTVISGKGGTGKTSLVACYAALASDAVLADCDVDAPDLHLVLSPTIGQRQHFVGGRQARIRSGHCIACGKCEELCRFEAIRFDGPELMVATPGGWLNPEYWPALEELKAFLLESDLVARVVTPLDFLRKVNQWEHDLDPAFYTLPATGEEALALWDPLGDAEKEEIKRLVRADGEEIRISSLIASTEAARFGELVDATRAHLATLPAPMSAEITGAVTRIREELAAMQDGPAFATIARAAPQARELSAQGARMICFNTTNILVNALRTLRTDLHA
jgi:ferredoxin